MKWTRTLLIIALSLVMMLTPSCSSETSVPFFRVTYLGTDGKTAVIHKVEKGQTDEPPADGELSENGEFYWSLTEDGDVYDFSTPVLGDITLYPIEKSKRVNVDFYYYDDVKITSKLCKVGSFVSVSDMGFSDKIYTAEYFDIESGEVFNSKLAQKAEGYSLACKISSDLMELTADGSLRGTDELRAMKGSYTLNIPRILNDKEVKAIDAEAFSTGDGQKAYSFDKLILPDSIVRIGEKAFMNAAGLTEVTVSSGLSQLCDFAFAGCSSLRSFTFQNGVTSIGKGAFRQCSAITEITVPESVKTIGAGAFEGCGNLGKVTLANGVETIGDNAFASCLKLGTIVIPNSVTYIGDDAFYDCAIMKEIIIDKDSQPSSIPGVIPWGGYEYYDKAIGGRSTKPYVFTVKNLKGEELFRFNPA